MNQHHFSRRFFLRGVGVSMALPWLESFNVWGDEQRGTKPASEAPVRLAVLFSGKLPLGDDLQIFNKVEM